MWIILRLIWNHIEKIIYKLLKIIQQVYKIQFNILMDPQEDNELFYIFIY